MRFVLRLTPLALKFVLRLALLRLEAGSSFHSDIRISQQLVQRTEHTHQYNRCQLTHVC